MLAFNWFDPEAPYLLTDEEQKVLEDLLKQFQSSERLATHVRFLVEKGTIYQIYNGNLLYHGCIPVILMVASFQCPLEKPLIRAKH